MIPRRAEWSSVSRKSVDEVAKMNSRGLSERIKALFGQSPGAISILQHSLSTFHQFDCEIRPSFACVQSGLDTKFAADGRLNGGKLTVQSKIKVAFRTFAQAIQENGRGPAAAKLEAYYIKYIGFLVGRIGHVRDHPSPC